MTAIRSARVGAPGAAFEIVSHEQPEPGRGQVRIDVEACGVCRTDSAFVNAGYPVTFPLVAGHEIAGRIDAVGDDAGDWKVGDRVAVGWFGGNCGVCVPCRAGEAIYCERLQVPGWAYPGGFAESVVVPSSAPARVPDAITSVEAAPMGCAGVATFNALRRSAARPGDLVAVLGLGGLGHLGVQFANKLGFEVVAIARGAARESDARALGAHHYVDGTAEDVVERLQALGGAKAVLNTSNSSAAMTAAFDGLRYGGELLVVGVDPAPIEISPFQLVPGGKTVHGHPSGTARDVEETLAFAALTGVRPITETAPLADVNAAYARMLSGEARFRMVLTR